MKIDLKVKKESMIRRILISVGIFIFVFCFEYFGVFQVIDNYVFDLAYMNDRSFDLPMSIIAIDEDTMNELGHPNFWTRDIYERVLQNIYTDDSEPAVVGFDIVFTGNRDVESDKALAEFANEHKNIVFGTRLEFDSEIVTDSTGAKMLDSSKIESIGDLYPELSATNPTTGFTNNSPVYDKYIRTFIPCFTNEEFTGDSFAYAIYKMYYEKNGLDPIDFTQFEHRQFRFSYSGGRGEVTPVSLIDVYKGERDYSKYFKNQIVLIGGYANGLQDDFFVPSDHTTTMYGVEVHTNIIEAMNDHAFQTDAYYVLTGLIYGLLSGLVFFAMCFLPLQIDAIIAIIVIGGNLLLGKALYDNGTVITQFSLFSAVFFSYIGMVIHHYVKARLAKNKISNAFKMYVAPQIVDEVAGKGDFVLNLGGRNKDIAVLFIDIRGFTTMSENLSPEEVVNILNEYFAVVTDAVFKNKGTIDKFIGDACMAVFNSPFDLDDYVYRAVHTGWDILQSGQQLQNTLMEKYGRTINFGIGVNCGEAVIGNIGCEFRMDYTAIGDTVNTSSRLESNAKAGQLLISEEVLRRLDGRLTVEEIGAIPLKGKSK
ncbi:MAG: adenylate/guanylate cyclase domain-containing protein, partial [Lachnospiraceae bacterium]|nr:adenylate/guanylate cyclase domain-containing protein [Lachnospiraceae bacterium]